MVKVFHIIARMDVGGAERVALSIARRQSATTRQHIVELQRGTSPFTAQILRELRDAGIPYHRSPFPVLFHWHYIAEKIIAILFPLRMLWLWLRYRPDIIHCHTEMPDMAAWLSLRLFPFMGVRVVRTIHNTQLWSGMPFVGPRVERFMQQRNANIAISPNVQQAYHKAYGTLPVVIYNGVEPVQQKRYEALPPADKDTQPKKKILFAGRLEEQKGIDVLCSIITALKNDARYHFYLFGAGRQQTLVDDLRTLPNVTINTPLHGLASYLSNFDYVIMPSRHEGLSIMALEASMNGVPLMINRCDGLTDTLPPHWPLAVTDNDLQQWLTLFRDVLPTIDRDALSHEAHRYASQHFSIEKMQQAYEALYNSLMVDNKE